MGKGAPQVAAENPKAKFHLGTFSAPPPLCLVRAPRSGAPRSGAARRGEGHGQDTLSLGVDRCVRGSHCARCCAGRPLQR